jgi:hypothetical protein
MIMSSQSQSGIFAAVSLAHATHMPGVGSSDRSRRAAAWHPEAGAIFWRFTDESEVNCADHFGIGKKDGVMKKAKALCHGHRFPPVSPDRAHPRALVCEPLAQLAGRPIRLSHE